MGHLDERLREIHSIGSNESHTLRSTLWGSQLSLFLQPSSSLPIKPKERKWMSSWPEYPLESWGNPLETFLLVVPTTVLLLVRSKHSMLRSFWSVSSVSKSYSFLKSNPKYSLVATCCATSMAFISLFFSILCFKINFDILIRTYINLKDVPVIMAIRRRIVTERSIFIKWIHVLFGPYMTCWIRDNDDGLSRGRNGKITSINNNINKQK